MSVENNERIDIGQRIYTLEDNGVLAFVEGGNNMPDLTANENDETEGNGQKEFVKWGEDNQYPYNLIDIVKDDEVLSPNKEMNIKTCYGAGLIFKDLDGKKTENVDVRKFLQRNNYPLFLISQITDMKYFYMSVDVIILNKDRSKIVQVRHKKMANIRFAPRKNGVIPYVLCGNFKEDKANTGSMEKIELLDIYDPLGDLNQRLGNEPGPDGKKSATTKESKFAVLTMLETPGDSYYSTPYYTSFIRSKWFEIKKMIPTAKLAKLKNISSLRYIVEIHEDYWRRICEQENIYDDTQKQERISQEKQNILNFVTGLENSGKTLFSTMYKDLDGKVVSEIKITVLNTQKEGGDWSEDSAEANNIACYSEGIHPNMIGASPGKGGMNNSGSDKRELFTMKQALETIFHDLMLNLQNVIIGFNGWDVEPCIPMITLTTLDKHKDAEVTQVNNLTDTRNE